ncbi:MAG TPA: alpha/beta hydrolase [Stellaceae bacterium]|jgi:acetyl esterase|nr:alpha/beta hydrolase [Stellaceae bacterium]
MVFDPATVVLDPEAKALLDMIAKSDRVPYRDITTAQAREQYRELCRRTRKAGEWPVAARDLSLPGPAGAVGARLYRPRAAGAAPLPVLAFFHGGGWCIGDLETHDAPSRQLAAEAGCAVLAVDYRLAPENPFPAAVEDCYAALRFLAAEGASLGIDSRRIAVGGDSAGGNLAAVVALMARDAGTALQAQVLIYPATDFSEARRSHEDFADGFLLTRESMTWFGGNYVGPSAHRDWRASPLLAPDHSGLPPALIIVGECDALRDESRDYAMKLSEAGSEASFHLYPGMIHGFLTMGGKIAAADRAIAQSAALLRRVFAAPTANA